MALMGKPEENDQSEDIGVDGKITLKCDWRSRVDQSRAE
jgi:hypothetical protein